MADDDTSMAVDGVSETDGELRGHGIQDDSSGGGYLRLDEDRSEAIYDPH